MFGHLKFGEGDEDDLIEAFKATVFTHHSSLTTHNSKERIFGLIARQSPILQGFLVGGDYDEVVEL